MRLHLRSFERPGFESLREFRSSALRRTTEQDIAVIERTFRGLHPQGLPAGVHSSSRNPNRSLCRLWVAAMAEVGAARPRSLGVL